MPAKWLICDEEAQPGSYAQRFSVYQFIDKTAGRESPLGTCRRFMETPTLFGRDGRG